MINREVEKLMKLVDSSEEIAICGHISPDGDCLGSGSSLYMALKKLGKDVCLIQNDKLPDYLNILEGLENYKPIYDEKVFDLFIAVDTASIDRLGSAEKLFNKAKSTASIDHHKTNTNFADLNIVDPETSSTCELVYEVVNGLNIEYDKKMARNTFIGILTDTNRFLYSNTSPRTLEISSKLTEFDIDREQIMQSLYQSTSLNSLYLSTEVVKKTDFSYGNKLAFCIIEKEDLAKLALDTDALEDKINLIRDIDTVELACMVREEKDFYKVSMRSKNHVDVSEIAEEFGGGGHKRAAGFSFNGQLKDLTNSLSKRFDKIDWAKI